MFAELLRTYQHCGVTYDCVLLNPYSDDPSSIPPEVYANIQLNMFEKNVTIKSTPLDKSNFFLNTHFDD